MNNKLKHTIYNLAPAVLTSLIATTLGLLSLFKSKVPMIQDFGMMLAIGIAVAFVLALLILLPVLVTRDKLVPQSKKSSLKQPSAYVRVIRKAVHFMYKIRYVILVIAVLAAGVGFYLDQKVGVETDFETFMPQDSEALADIRELRKLVGSTDRIVLLYSNDDIQSLETLNDVVILTAMIQENYQEKTEAIASVSLLLNQISGNSWTSDNYQTYLDLIPSEQLRLLQDTDTQQGIIN
ncbi:MAG: hypothetical protein KJ847_01220, partial [Firmicutes bacterium]|nr:hypothetical protein [Bacillota bacterium]